MSKPFKSLNAISWRNNDMFNFRTWYACLCYVIFTRTMFVRTLCICIHISVMSTSIVLCIRYTLAFSVCTWQTFASAIRRCRRVFLSGGNFLCPNDVPLAWTNARHPFRIQTREPVRPSQRARANKQSTAGCCCCDDDTVEEYIYKNAPSNEHTSRLSETVLVRYLSQHSAEFIV